MKLKLYKEWQNKAEFENLLFFSQRLDELFFDYTLDTYKPAALNSTYLCKEAIALIEDIENNLIDQTNLEHVIQELEWSLSTDLVAKKMLNAPSEKFLLYGKDVKLTDTKIRLEVLEKILNPLRYFEICRAELKLEIKGGSKKNIQKLTELLASTLINKGISKQHLYDSTQEFFFYGDEIGSIEELDKFFYQISPTIHGFEIYFITSKLINQVKDTIDNFDLNIIESLPEHLVEFANSSGLTPNENEVWVEIKNTEAFDRHSARKQAETRLELTRDLFLLFSHKNRIEWREEAIITQCCNEAPVLTKRPKNSMEKCFDLRTQDASKRLNMMIRNIGLTGSAFSKFHRVVDLHAISTTNELPENQLLNIWIALETLVPSHVHGGGKVSKISNGLMPILLKNYIQRLIERLAGDLVRWNRSKISKIFRKIPDSKNKNLYQKTLELVALPENSNHLKSLYAELNSFPLLRFRLFEISEMLKKPENITKRIELHEKKVEWQIRRIYRTRNLIVHSGRSLAYIDTLIENAHDYLDQAINNVIQYSCGILDATTLEQTFDMAKIDYEIYIKKLKNITNIDNSNVEILI